MVGIPQGSVLSALLCSFFYGDLERRHFKFTDDSHSVSSYGTYRLVSNLSTLALTEADRRLLVHYH